MIEIDELDGDKSISQRLLIFAAMANGRSVIKGLSSGADTLSTLSCINTLLGETVAFSKDEMTIHSSGCRSWRSCDLHFENSGTCARLLLGVLCSLENKVFDCKGDSSLSKRPMRRLTDLLQSLGASFKYTSKDELPVHVTGEKLQNTQIKIPYPSAQLKSSLMMAALNAAGDMRIEIAAYTRDHSELFLKKYHPEHIRITRTGEKEEIWIKGGCKLTSFEERVPKDPSSAAIMVTAAILFKVPLTCKNVLANPLRTQFFNTLERCGLGLSRSRASQWEDYCEPVCDITVSQFSSFSKIITCAKESVMCIDEIPMLALIAAFLCTDESRFENIGELKLKESNRLKNIIEILSVFGAVGLEKEDALVIKPRSSVDINKVRVLELLDKGFSGDHRIIMMATLAASYFGIETRPCDYDQVAVSFPNFDELLKRLVNSVC